MKISLFCIALIELLLIDLMNELIDFVGDENIIIMHLLSTTIQWQSVSRWHWVSEGLAKGSYTLTVWGGTRGIEPILFVLQDERSNQSATMTQLL